MSKRSPFNLSRLAIEYSRVTVCCWLAIAVTGLVAFSSLEYALFPAVNFPVVVVRVAAETNTVLDTEAEITNPLETALANVPGLAQLFSATYQGQAVANILFDTDIALQDATANIEGELERLTLPSTKIDIIPFNLNETSAVSYVLTSQRKSLEELSSLAATEVIPQIEKLSGVERVDLLGTSQAESDIPTANSNALIHFNGKEAIAFQVIKQADANTLEVVRRVEQQVRSQSSLKDVELTLAETPANYIRDSIRSTIETLIFAVILAVVVIFPFLKDFTATAIAAIAIPVSLLATCIMMALAGFNFETLTLLALALAIGIIVDDAIVEVENIMRHLEAGETPREAALSATREIGLTASISTLTIVAVFLPVGLMGGTLGQFFRPFGLTISAAVLTSLLAARTLVPVLAVYWLAPRKIKFQERQQGKFSLAYRNLLQWSLNHRRRVIAIASASFIAGIALIPLIPQGFVPNLDRGEFKIAYTTPLPKLSQVEAARSDSSSATSSSFSWLKAIARYRPKKSY